MRRAVASPPALHRYVNNLPSWIVAVARRVLDEYRGDAERIRNDDPTAEDLRRRLERFQGIGQNDKELPRVSVKLSEVLRVSANDGLVVLAKR